MEINKNKKLSGYAETYFSTCIEFKPKNIDDCKKIINYARQNKLTICSKGSGLSYADMITNQNNIVVDYSLMNKINSWNKNTGEIYVEPGVTFKDLFKLVFLNNWTLNSCPGSIDISIGGAISNNVHGKDSYSNGNFGKQIKQISLLLASGKIIKIDRNYQENIFNSVISGMGNLGIIIEAKIQLSKIESPYVLSYEKPTNNIYETIDLIQKNKKFYDFSVAWVDCFCKNKKKLGRGFIVFGKWLKENKKISKKKLEMSFKKSNKVFNLIPISIAWPIVKIFFNRKSIKFFNSLFYFYIKIKFYLKKNKDNKILFTDYNFMHNQIPDIKNIHLPYGFLEFQPLIPTKNIKKFIPELFNLCDKYKTESTLCALKLHSKDEFLMSYSDDAYSIGIDVPLKNREIKHIKEFANLLFELVCKYEGKIYLAKDEMLNKENLYKMYTNTNKFLKIKNNIDPENLFSSDLFKRLF